MPVPSFFFELGGSPIANAVAAVLGKALPIGRDLGLDPETNDLALFRGDLTLVTDGAAIVQEVNIRLAFLLGEWFLDIEAGLPYFEDINVKSPNLAVIRTIFINEILSVAGIASVTAFALDFNRQTRHLKITWSADTDFGELSSETEI